MSTTPATTSTPMVGTNEKGSSSSYLMNRILLKAKYSFYSALVFFLLINPETITLLQRALGGVVTLTGSSGALTMVGVFFLTGLFFMTMLGLMLLPSE